MQLIGHHARQSKLEISYLPDGVPLQESLHWMGPTIMASVATSVLLDERVVEYSFTTLPEWEEIVGQESVDPI